MAEKKSGRTEGNGATQRADGKKKRYDNFNTSEDLSLQVKEVEREYSDVLERFLIPFGLECCAAGRKFSVGERLDWLSWHGSARVNHDVHPILARILIERLPQAKSLIELRRSKWDAVFDGRKS